LHNSGKVGPLVPHARALDEDSPFLSGFPEAAAECKKNIQFILQILKYFLNQTLKFFNYSSVEAA